jgi:Mn-dependent DtxR family transcriptional regulator
MSPALKTLSPRQTAMVAAVESLTASRGIPPSLSELADELGVDPSRAAALAHECVRKGALTHEPRVARSWRVAATAGRERQKTA